MPRSNSRSKRTLPALARVTAMALNQFGLSIGDSLVNAALYGKSKPAALSQNSGNLSHSGLLAPGNPIRSPLRQIRLGSVVYGHGVMARSGGEIWQPW
jgi:hypothetical protein